MLWVLSMAKGKKWSLEEQSCEPGWEILCCAALPMSPTATGTFIFSATPTNLQSPTKGSSGLRDLPGFTHQLSTCPPVPKHPHRSELSGTLFSHFLGVCICSYCFKSPPRWTKTPLQLSLHKPDPCFVSLTAGSHFFLSDRLCWVPLDLSL